MAGTVGNRSALFVRRQAGGNYKTRQPRGILPTFINNFMFKCQFNLLIIMEKNRY